VGKQPAQLEETTYSFFRGGEELRFVADEDGEVITTVSYRSAWQQGSTEELLFSLRIYSQT
jgi:hypothetical protein